MAAPAEFTDKASYRNRGGWLQRLISLYKAWRYLTACGEGVVIKSSVEFRLTRDAVLEVGGGLHCRTDRFFN